MKRFVARDFKASVVLAVVVYAIALLIHAGEAVILLLGISALALYLFYEERPDWLRNSPLGRWLRR